MGNIQVQKARSTVQLGKEKHKPRNLQQQKCERESYNAPIVEKFPHGIRSSHGLMDLSQAADSSFVRGASGMIRGYSCFSELWRTKEKQQQKQQWQTLLFLKKLLVMQAIPPRLFSPTQKKAISAQKPSDAIHKLMDTIKNSLNLKLPFWYGNKERAV